MGKSLWITEMPLLEPEVRKTKFHGWTESKC